MCVTKAETDKCSKQQYHLEILSERQVMFSKREGLVSATQECIAIAKSCLLFTKFSFALSFAILRPLHLFDKFASF